MIVALELVLVWVIVLMTIATVSGLHRKSNILKETLLLATLITLYYGLKVLV